MIKLIKLDGDWIISTIEEIPETEFGDPDCILKHPYQIEGSCFGSYPAYSDDTELVIRSSDITIICEPKPTLLKNYLELLEQET
jgi:hypothetical protein